MATYAQNTPALRARGKYVVRSPFTVANDVDYTCIAIRSFKDIYREGTNPYTTIYTPVGLVDGAVVDGSTFSFAEEEIKGINIVTLADDLGRCILVPDNYISSIPTTSSVSYLEYILSVSLGALPDDIDLSAAQTAIIEAVGNQFGIDATVLIHTLATSTSPTYEQHLALEAAREAKIKLGTSNEALIKLQQAQLDEQSLKIAALTQILVDNNLMPS
jgi:hypothetical protein